MIDKKEVGKRLRTFGKTKFGKLNLLAAALDMSSPSLQSYLTGRSLPGAEIITKLKNLGCDTDWLLLVKDEPLGDRVEDKGNLDYLKNKDEIILSQADEIHKLKEEVKKLKVKLLQVEDVTTKEKPKEAKPRSEKSNSKRRKMTAKAV